MTQLTPRERFGWPALRAVIEAEAYFAHAARDYERGRGLPPAEAVASLLDRRARVAERLALATGSSSTIGR